MSFFNYLVAVVISSLILINTAQADDEEIDRGPVYHITTDIDMIPTTKLEYDRPRVVIKAIVPRLVSDEEYENLESYNTAIMEIINQEADDFREEVKTQADYQKSMVNTDVKNDVIIDFDSALLNLKRKNPIISLRFAIHGVVSGMPYSYRRHRVLNYNLSSGEIIELADLFTENANYLDVLAIKSREMLNDKLKDKSYINYGASPTIEHYQNWNLTPSGLRITFERNQVAPAVYGAQTITIPYRELADIIDPDSILGKCIKRKRRCFRNNKFTGGFIDEAHNTKYTRKRIHS